MAHRGRGELFAQTVAAPQTDGAPGPAQRSAEATLAQARAAIGNYLDTPGAEPPGLAALRVVLGCEDARELRALQRRQAELRRTVKRLARRLHDAQAACPVVFARPRDATRDRLFFHPRSDADALCAADIFEFLGRSAGGDLVFRHLAGEGFGASYDAEGPGNGGVRDLIGAWPVSSYVFTHGNGGRDPDRELQLPTSMVWAFRVPDPSMLLFLRGWRGDGDGDSSDAP